MEIKITSRQTVNASDSLRETITEELNKLEKFYDKITSCHVVLGSESMDKIKTTEITMNIQGNQIAASAKAENIGKAIDEAIGKVERQLKKINEKAKEHKAPKMEIGPEE